MYISHMAIKTVSLKTEAYERLKTARRYPGESFSEVILRASWPEDTITLVTRNTQHFQRVPGLEVVGYP